MSNNIMSGEVLSFVDLLDKHKIEIPIIQRDYAQGRVENKDIRLDFLNALKSNIIENKPIKLDFIYGEIIDDVFQPLDGQQRLTTLFLLHWYAAVKDNELNESSARLLSRFTYETRLSSRYFCNCLVEKRIELNPDKKVSDVIRNTNWFYMSWEQDPSIKAMLNTLDDIEENFNTLPDLWECLTGQKLITFHYLNLPDLGLSDDLYIKMNARGKPLSHFENLKAQMQIRIESEKWEKNYAVTDKFDHKIDSVWTELFWKRFSVRMDDAHIKFISAITMFKVALNRDKYTTSERHGIIRRINDSYDGKYLFRFMDKGVYDYLYQCYDIFVNAEEKQLDLDISCIPFWTHECRKSVLNEIASESSYTKKVMLFAQIEFLQRNNNFNREAYISWMRIIRNLVCYANVTIKTTSSREDFLRDPTQFDNMINMINVLADGSENIYNYLVNYNERAGFHKEQIIEEVTKAKKIIQSSDIKEIIWKFEDLDLFRGKISSVLECASLIDDSKSEKERLENLYDAVFVPYFYNDHVFSANLFNRTMLTITINNEHNYYDFGWTSSWYVANAFKRKFIVNLMELYYYINKGADSRRFFIGLLAYLYNAF